MKTYKRRKDRKKKTQKRKRGGTRTFLSGLSNRLSTRRSILNQQPDNNSIIENHNRNTEDPFKIGVDKMKVGNYYIIFFKIPTRTDESAEVPDYSVDAYEFFRKLNHLNSYDKTGYIRSFSFASDGFKIPFLIKYLGPEENDNIKVGLSDDEFIFPKTEFLKVIDKLIPIDIAEFRVFKKGNNGGVDTVVNTTNNGFITKIKHFLTRKQHTTKAAEVVAAEVVAELENFYKDFNSINIQNYTLLRVYFKKLFKELVLIAREKGIPEEVMDIIVSYLLIKRNNQRVRY